jgi:hypothetical protein
LALNSTSGNVDIVTDDVGDVLAGGSYGARRGIDHYDMIERGYNLFVADYPDYPDVGYDGTPLDGWLAAIADVILDVDA